MGYMKRWKGADRFERKRKVRGKSMTQREVKIGSGQKEEGIARP